MLWSKGARRACPWNSSFMTFRPGCALHFHQEGARGARAPSQLTHFNPGGSQAGSPEATTPATCSIHGLTPGARQI